ncbi:tetratricopeptide repeat protein [Aeromonas allosaccharophila]|uniref:Tetratricopeptide repeat protein n=1 Tax=Aeromonas allosaccharophila TaxID=656 RepID=A0AAX3P1G8_9GAMM|nr:tetratricopeptide repeat protein [Aeromonas allosaccharophila]WED79442.1 tetratricopeptide repeat protein [Aeromonas allosaccharophila]
MKKEILALLVVVACWGSTLQANDWKNAPISEVQKAAEQGLAEAQIVLGLMYARGEGVAQDDKQAVVWTRKAAEQGDAKAQLLLGAMYFDGRGVAQDYKLAYVWSSVSAANGDVEAATKRDLFAKRLSPAVLAEAQALAGQYVELYQPKQ